MVKPLSFANSKEGWDILLDKLARLDVLPEQVLIGMEATARYSENLYHELEQRGYRLCLLHSGQTHQFHERCKIRGKDRQKSGVKTGILEVSSTQENCAGRDGRGGKDVEVYGTSHHLLLETKRLE